MYLFIVFLPLMGSFIVGFLSFLIGFKGAISVSIFCISMTCMLSYLAFYEVALCKSPCIINSVNWISSEMFDVSWGFLFDTLTVSMLVLVTTVSLIVHIYSIGYMEADPHIFRFMSYLSFFTFFMIILVTADNFVQMFIGWEGVGLCSYLLINFWFTRIQANKAAIKAVILNRVGDIGIVLGVCLIFKVFKSVKYSTVFALVPYFFANDFFIDSSVNFCGVFFDIIFLICIFLLIGAMGKSAQIGLHTWLPDAMEGPTPVSALIHAATMVTAGVFLIARCSPLFEFSPTALVFVTCVGSMTAFFAATTALVQNDLKRVIAYSTCSQLGYMVFACGISQYHVGVFHLLNHGFFKALLFLTAGAIIHGMADEQDMRKMGGLAKIFPYSYSLIFIGSLSLAGFPFLTGFYSKDAILEYAFAEYTVNGHFAFFLGVFGAFLTAFYSMRLIFLTFINRTNIMKRNIFVMHDMPNIMGLPLLVLVFGSIFIGYLSKEMFIGFGTDFWGVAIFQNIHLKNLVFFEMEFIPFYAKMAPLFFSVSGLSLAFVVYKNRLFSIIDLFDKNKLSLNFYNFFNRKWFFDRVYNDLIAQKVLSLGYHKTYKLIDRGIIEVLGPYGFSYFFYNMRLNFLFFQTGYIYHYAFVIFLGIIIFLALFGFGFFDYVLLFLFIICFGLFFLNNK